MRYAYFYRDKGTKEWFTQIHTELLEPLDLESRTERLGPLQIPSSMEGIPMTEIRSFLDGMLLVFFSYLKSPWLRPGRSKP